MSRGTTPRTRSRRGAVARIRCRRVSTCSSRRSPSPPRRRSGTTRTGRRPARTACPTTGARRATTAGSARSTAVRSTPRATRSRRCGARCGAATARSGPRAWRSRSWSTRTGKRSRGVRYVDADGVEQTVTADAVVVACGAFETPRLLLRSELGNSSDLVGRFLMFHLQTIVLGFFPFRLHAHKGRDVTHLMDDPIVGDAESAARGAGCGSALPARRDRRARRERSPDHGGHPPPARRGPQRADGRFFLSRQDGRVHHAGGGPPAGHQPRRSRRRRARRVGPARRAHHVSAAPPRRRLLAPLGAPARSRAPGCGGARHVVGHVAGHAGHRGARSRADLTALDGHRPHGR